MQAAPRARVAEGQDMFEAAKTEVWRSADQAARTALTEYTKERLGVSAGKIIKLAMNRSEAGCPT